MTEIAHVMFARTTWLNMFCHRFCPAKLLSLSGPATAGVCLSSRPVSLDDWDKPTTSFSVGQCVFTRYSGLCVIIMRYFDISVVFSQRALFSKATRNMCEFLFSRNTLMACLGQFIHMTPNLCKQNNHFEGCL